ncbi:Ctr copper transporter [Irpex lacteus]|nr:Ctr copper transporter [Irpex lacteus]
MPTPACSLNMLWNTQIQDTCIVFSSWHITSTASFLFSFLVIVALGVLYEWLREAQKAADRKIAATLSAQGKGKGTARVSGRTSPDDHEEAGLLTGLRVVKDDIGTPLPITLRTSRALLYGAQVFLSFFLMLVFMTYNAYLILATVLGAVLGHFIFNPRLDVEGILSGAAASSRGMACH